MKNTLQKYIPLSPYAIFGILIFLGSGHHLLNFWEQPVIKMLLLFLFFAPLYTMGLFFFGKWISPQVEKSGKKRFYLLIASALIVGSLFSLKFYRSPEAYHLLEIIPSLEGTERIELVEVKADKSVLEIRDNEISEANWKRDGELIIATENSQPLKISFKSKANTPVIILLSAFHEGGEIEAFLGKEIGEISTYRQDRGHTTLRLISQYRVIPNWLFSPLLALADIVFFGSIILLLLLIQERGMSVSESSTKGSVNHRKNLLILLSTTFILHLFNSLTTPLILDVDTPSYLSGAVHWLKFGTLDGTHAARGIGSTFLFTPILLLFGRNPWGMKILLHLFAISCVPLAYKIGWQLTQKTKVAFLAGFFAMLTPDIMLYTNYLWSDLINLTAVLIFTTALLSALRKPTFLRIFVSMFIGAMATLFRTENMTLLPIGLFFLLWEAIKVFDLKAWKKKKNLKKQQRTLGIISTTGISFVIAIVPLLLSASHNQKLHGFFGLSNYAGAVFYDGWIYFGDASKLNFSNQNSEAIQKINAAREIYPAEATDNSNVPTSIETAVSLKKAGYTDEEIMQLYTDAVLDSISNDWELTFKLIEIKIVHGLRPFATHIQTFPLPGESFNPGTTKEQYYDLEKLSIPVLINLQRKINTLLSVFYLEIYPYIVWLMLPAIFFSIYRKPSTLWLLVFVITTTRIFIPLIMGASLWRFALAGLVPMQILAVSWIVNLYEGIRKQPDTLL
jgi:hypothetical protein